MKATTAVCLGTLLTCWFSAEGAMAVTCEAEVWRDYRGTRLWRLPGSAAYFYTTERMAIDADGAPDAYHPGDEGIDALANAGHPNGGWRSVLVVDPSDHARPYVQPSGEFEGYFVAMTTLRDETRPVTDPGRYVDSGRIPYMVFPGAFHAITGTGTFGDLALARNLDNGRRSAAIVADAGPRDAGLGEVSIRLAENLGGRDVDPRNGAGMPNGRLVYVVFPESKERPAWPVEVSRLEARAGELLDAVGGWERILACVP
jgi:Fungal chitosanase of glycosyl hydrolase group 75